MYKTSIDVDRTFLWLRNFQNAKNEEGGLKIRIDWGEIRHKERLENGRKERLRPGAFEGGGREAAGATGSRKIVRGELAVS